MHKSIERTLTRRQAVKTGAAAVITSGAVLATPPALSGTHDPLVDLEREWGEATERAKAADTEITAAEETLPIELRQPPMVRVSRSIRFALPQNIDSLERALYEQFGNTLEDGNPVRVAMADWCQSLKDGLQEAYEEWSKARAAHGIDKLSDAAEREWAQVERIEEAINITAPTSGAGVAVKLRLALSYIQPDEAEYAVAQLEQLASDADAMA